MEAAWAKIKGTLFAAAETMAKWMWKLLSLLDLKDDSLHRPHPLIRVIPPELKDRAAVEASEAWTRHVRDQ